MKCSNLAFDTNIIKNNVGFYTSLIVFAFEIVSSLVFVKNGLKSIKNFMLIFEPMNGIAHPPKLKNLLSLAETNNNNNKENKKEEEIQKTILINHLLSNKTKNKKIKKQKNEIDDALVVKYTQSDNDDYDSNRKSIHNLTKKDNNKINKNDKEDEKNIFESDSDSEKEKRTRITRKINIQRKKTDKRNNLIDINNEKPKYLHPMDNLDTLSFTRNNDKNKTMIPKKKIYINKNSESNSEDIDEDIKNTDEDKFYDDIKKNKKHKKDFNKKEEKEKKSQKSRKKNKEKEQNNNDNKVESSRNKNKKLSTHTHSNNKQKNKNNNYVTSEELSIMEYEESIKNDKRKFSKMYWEYIIENNYILSAFISESFINLRSIKINYLCFRLEIIFVLNALFYTDSYISKAYYNNGNLDFIISLPKAFYSFLVSMLVTIFLKLLSINKKDIYKIIKNKEDKDDNDKKKDYLEYKDLINIILYKTKIKLIIFFIIQFIFSFIFMYYITAFCSVYQNSKIYWLFGCLETLAIDMIFPFIYCLFIASFRYLGIRRRIKCLYYFASILDILL